ncbi:DUF294 nucleotidyltransferase-like domain-containing protein [Vibrio sp.]|uniref:DUF294 nucleotidyltransferase-like domain-containing protein n=1 Tax=Vibrio sp. TaxID=678 RepID=UPI003D121AB9
MHQELLPNVVSFLQSITPFEQLQPDILNQIAKSVDILYLGQDEYLEATPNSEQHFIYLIRAGVIEQRYLDHTLRSRLGEYDIFGFSWQTDAQALYHVIAIENTLLYRINYDTLFTLVSAYPDVVAQFSPNIPTRLSHTPKTTLSTQAKDIFLLRVCDVLNPNILIVAPETTIQQVAYRMHNELRSPCAAIVDNKKLIGLVTDKDMTKRVVAQGWDIQRPISSIMTTDLHTVHDGDLVLKATELMMQYHIQNIPVIDASQQIMGIITPQQLIQKHSIQAIFLTEKITHVDSVQSLIALSHERDAIFEALVENQASANIVGQMMAMIYDAFTCQLLKLAETHLGSAPCAYAWIVAGSHARNEIHLSSDQDNALILDDCVTDKDRIYFSHLAMYMCKGLAECGYSLCTGRFMAVTRQWCQPLKVWQEYYRKWARTPEYDQLLKLNVFIEIRYIAGDKSLFEQLDTYRHARITHNSKLMAALVCNALKTRPPLGIFNNLVLKKDGNSGEKILDIKHSAINCLVDMARIYALNEGGHMLDTETRLAFAHQKSQLSDSTYQDCLGIYQYLTHLRHQHQVKALQNGQEINNKLLPSQFGSFERQHLKDAFRIISGLQEAMRMKFGQ